MKYSVFFVCVLLTISQVLSQPYNPNFPLGGVDLDGDGFFSLPSNGRFHDCCDSVADGCPDPFLVNPGAYSIPNNGINDRCSYNCQKDVEDPYAYAVFCEEFLSDPGFPCDAQNEEHNLIGTDTRAALTEKAVLAMDICEFKDDDDDPSWGFERQYNLYFSLADGTRNGWDIGITGPDDIQAAVLKSFGRLGPVFGETMVGISSGSANAGFQTSDQNYLYNPLGASVGSTLVDLPQEFQNNDANFNPTCPIVPTGLYDSIMGTMNIVQPTNMHAYSIKILYLDNEVNFDTAFEDFCQPFQSAFFIFTNGTGRSTDGGNIAFDVNGDQIRSFNPDRDFYTQCAKWVGDWPDNTCYDSEIHLEYTNFEFATNWIPVGTSALPREIFELQFLTFDGVNGDIDTTVLLDDFRVMYEARAGFEVAEVTCATSYDGKPNPIYNSEGYPYCDFIQTPYGYQYTGDIALVSMIPDTIGIYPVGTKTVTFSFVVRNEGPEYAGDVTLYLTPPFGTKFTSTTGDFTCSIYQIAEKPFVDNSFYKCKTADNYPLAPHETYSGTITYTLTYPTKQPVGRSEISFRITAATSSIDEVFGNNHITQLIKIGI